MGTGRHRGVAKANGSDRDCRCALVLDAVDVAVSRGAEVFPFPYSQPQAMLLTPIRPPLRDRKFADSLLEGDGFEPSVPRKRTPLACGAAVPLFRVAMVRAKPSL